MSQRWCALGCAVPALLLWAPARALAEATMLRHMVLVFPCLLIAGWWAAQALGERTRAATAPYDVLGLPALIFVSSALTVWMIPNAMDMAKASLGVDVAKTLSLFVAGGALRLVSWHAGLITQLFFVGNWVTMTVYLGVLFQSLPSRLCNAYRIDDQANAGVGLVLLGAVGGGAWTIHAYMRASSPSPQASSPTTAQPPHRGQPLSAASPR